jgi:hypothetical protein
LRSVCAERRHAGQPLAVSEATSLTPFISGGCVFGVYCYKKLPEKFSFFFLLFIFPSPTIKFGVLGALDILVHFRRTPLMRLHGFSPVVFG